MNCTNSRAELPPPHLRNHSSHRSSPSRVFLDLLSDVWGCWQVYLWFFFHRWVNGGQRVRVTQGLPRAHRASTKVLLTRVLLRFTDKRYWLKEYIITQLDISAREEDVNKGARERLSEWDCGTPSLFNALYLRVSPQWPCKGFFFPKEVTAHWGTSTESGPKYRPIHMTQGKMLQTVSRPESIFVLTSQAPNSLT